MPETNENSTDENVERILCHNCMAPNPVHADFCQKCNTPLSTHAAYDPLMQITASGDTYIKATTGRPGWLKTLGIMLIFGPVSLHGLIGVAQFSEETFTSFEGGLSFIIALAQVLIGLFVILKTILRNFIPIKPERGC